MGDDKLLSWGVKYTGYTPRGDNGSQLGIAQNGSQEIGIYIFIRYPPIRYENGE
jgi:hypothetical protein